jgi:hypothetical protein
MNQGVVLLCGMAAGSTGDLRPTMLQRANEDFF